MLIQTGGGLLEMCVLAVLDREDLYGYRLTRQVRQVLDVSESALYPVLRRLKKKDCWRPMTRKWMAATGGTTG